MNIFTKTVMLNKKLLPLWKRLYKPDGTEYANMLRHHKVLHAMGDHCSIIPDTHLDMPHLISLGNNVRLASCVLMCHDGVINMLERAYGDKLDAVGSISIGNNVFIGHGAMIMRNVSIGNNVVVAARAVVNKNLADGWVYAGVPAKPVCTIEQLRSKLLKQSQELPWYELIQQRQGGFDPKIEHTLDIMREQHFFEK